MLFKEIKRINYIEPIRLGDKLADFEIEANTTTILTCSPFDIKEVINAQISNRVNFDYEHYFGVAYPVLEFPEYPIIYSICEDCDSRSRITTTQRNGNVLLIYCFDLLINEVKVDNVPKFQLHIND